MTKKVALLVKTTFFSRVVVEVPEDWDSTTKKELWLDNTIPLHGKMEDDIIKQTQTNQSIALQTLKVRRSVLWKTVIIWHSGRHSVQTRLQ